MDQSIFSGKKFYIIFSNDYDIKSLLIEVGALFQSYLSESVSFAISDSNSASEVGEAEDIYNVAVVTSEWVRLCLQWGKFQYMKSFHPNVRLLFKQLTFYIANIGNEDKEKLKGYIRVFGGCVTETLTEEVTHVIIGTIEGEAHDNILCRCTPNMTVVTPNWMIQSINNRCLQGTTPFQPQVLYERLKSLQISTEIERANQSKKAVMAPPPEVSKRLVSEPTPVIASAQFTLSGLQQAVPISIQDSLLTRQLPTSISRPDPPSYQLPSRTLPQPKSSPAICASMSSLSATPTVSTQQSSSTKSKSSKSNNKHLQEQGLNESEKEAIVMQNVISILGQTHSKRTTSSVTNVSEKNSMSTAVRKPRSPRPKINKSQSVTTLLSASAIVSNPPSKPPIPQNPTVGFSLAQSIQCTSNNNNLQSTACSSLQISNAVSSIVAEMKVDPKSPQIENQMKMPQQQQSQHSQPQLVSNIARYGMVCGLPTSGLNQNPYNRPQNLLNRPQDSMDTDIDKQSPGKQISHVQLQHSISKTQMCTSPSQAPFQNLFLHQQQQQPQQQQQQVPPSQQIIDQVSIHGRQIQRQMQQQQQQQQQQQHQQQQRQLITLGQIQTPSHQVNQHWPNAAALHMSPNQHSAPSAATLLSPGGLCATVTGHGVPQSPAGHQMYQLNPQQTQNYCRWISQQRPGIINNGNQMMLNNMGTVPLNASMVTNVATPLHLQSSVGNGNPATIMLHQQQLHVPGNLPQSSMHSPNGCQTAVPLSMTPGKIITGAGPRTVLQHSPQLTASNLARTLGPNNSYSALQPGHHSMMQNGVAIDHNTPHHTTNTHLNRSLTNILRLPQYVGNDGATIAICRENCLIGCVFYLYGYEEVSQAKKDNWLSSIRNHGGETVSTYNAQMVTHLIVDCQLEDPDLFKMALKNKTRVVTIYWVNDVIDKGHLEPPFEIIHLPSPFSKNLSFSYIRRQIVSITGFEGEERKKVEYMVINLGVKYTDYLEASNTVLICKKISGRKYEAAQKLGIACVNVRWLQDLYFGDLLTLSAEVEHKYQSFEPADVSIRLERMTPRVQELMVGWIVPIRLDENSWKRYRVLKDQTEHEKNTRKRQAEASLLPSSVNAKKLKWQLPALSPEEIELANSCLPVTQPRQNLDNIPSMALKPDNIDTIDDLLQQNENQQRVFVAFTGLLPEQRDKLADLVASLGGQVTEDMAQCTHLVAKSIIRTPKFYYAILRGCHVVTMKWVQACAHRQQFIDESRWKLEDKEGERQFGFSLELSLHRGRSRLLNHTPALFQSLEFFLSPRAKHRQICIDLIRACGGIIREKRPIQKMALMQEPRHLIICHEDDSHLANYLTRTKTGNKAVHHEEFVLSCVMRQELDFDSYQIQYIGAIKNAFNNPPVMPNVVEQPPAPATVLEAALGRDSPSRSVVSDTTVDMQARPETVAVPEEPPVVMVKVEETVPLSSVAEAVLLCPATTGLLLHGDRSPLDEYAVVKEESVVANAEVAVSCGPFSDLPPQQQL